MDEEELNLLTAKQRELTELMSDISQACWCATWMSSLEFDLWRIVQNGGSHYGQDDIAPETIEKLRLLSNEIAGWITWEEGPIYISMGAWLNLYGNKMV